MGAVMQKNSHRRIVGVTMDVKLHDKVIGSARRDRVSVSAWLREAARLFLKQGCATPCARRAQEEDSA